MKIIAADIGNSAIKIGFQSDSEFMAFRLNSPQQLKDLDLPQVDCFWSVCSVNQIKCTQLKNWVQTQWPNDYFHEISHDEIPLQSNVDDRQQVGLDRLVAAFQANQYRPDNEELVVIDAGTAVTIDLIDSESVFQGGVIFPGAGTNLQSLAKAACDLPDLTIEEFDLTMLATNPIGKNTRDAILSGIFHSQIESIINIANQLTKDGNVLATGGESKLLANFLPKSWKFCDQLVLQGTCEIGRLHRRQ